MYYNIHIEQLLYNGSACSYIVELFMNYMKKLLFFGIRWKDVLFIR